MKIKNRVLDFQNFLLEAFEDNTGIPAQYRDRIISNGTLRYEKGYDEVSGLDFSGSREMERIQNIEENKRKLESLAMRIIKDNYTSDILDNMILKITIGDPTETPIGAGLNESEEGVNLVSLPQSDREIRLKNAIDRKQLIDLLQQGESKNVWNLVKTYKGELKALLGNENGEAYYSAMEKVSRATDIQDWHHKLDTQTSERIFSTPSGRVDIDYGTSSELKENENVEISRQIPVVSAIGKDLLMVLHEAIKGIYFIVAGGMGYVEKEFRKEVKRETSGYLAEMVNLRYGKEMAKDLREFIESLPLGNWGYPENMVERFTNHVAVNLKADEFLALMYEIFEAILMENSAIKASEKRIIKTRNKVNRILEEIKKEIDPEERIKEAIEDQEIYISEITNYINELEMKISDLEEAEEYEEIKNIQVKIAEARKQIGEAQDEIETLKYKLSK